MITVHFYANENLDDCFYFQNDKKEWVKNQIVAGFMMGHPIFVPCNFSTQGEIRQPRRCDTWLNPQNFLSMSVDWGDSVDG